MSERPPIDYEPPRGPTPGAVQSFVAALLGGMNAFWMLVAAGFALAKGPLPPPTEAWMLSCGVVPTALIGLAIGIRHGGSRFGPLAIGLNAASLLASGFTLAAAWLLR